MNFQEIDAIVIIYLTTKQFRTVPGDIGSE